MHESSDNLQKQPPLNRRKTMQKKKTIKNVYSAFLDLDIDTNI